MNKKKPIGNPYFSEHLKMIIWQKIVGHTFKMLLFRCKAVVRTSDSTTASTYIFDELV